MLEAGSRKRNQPAPPHVMFEALTQPDRDPARPWLELLDDEQRPRVVEASKPGLVVWSSLWIKRPDTIVRFDLPPDSSGYGQIFAGHFWSMNLCQTRRWSDTCASD